jgi:hypothetical protein
MSVMLASQSNETKQGGGDGTFGYSEADGGIGLVHAANVTAVGEDIAVMAVGRETGGLILNDGIRGGGGLGSGDGDRQKGNDHRVDTLWE